VETSTSSLIAIIVFAILGTTRSKIVAAKHSFVGYGVVLLLSIVRTFPLVDQGPLQRHNLRSTRESRRRPPNSKRVLRPRPSPAHLERPGTPWSSRTLLSVLSRSSSYPGIYCQSDGRTTCGAKYQQFAETNRTRVLGPPQPPLPDGSGDILLNVISECIRSDLFIRSRDLPVGSSLARSGGG